jgi:sn-glycerol 3-phosphate transport system substrate-binding protein
VHDELEQAFAGTKPAKTALDDAVRRGNAVLRQFEKSSR